MGEPQGVHTRTAAVALAAGRIPETDLPETGRAGLDVIRFRVVEQFKLQPLKDSSSPSAEIRFVKTLVSTKVGSSGISTTVAAFATSL